MFTTYEAANRLACDIDHLARPEKRDVPLLYPALFHRILTTVGASATAENLGGLLERASLGVRSQALWYFGQAADKRAPAEFLERFANVPAERLTSECDDMIDWLWAWDRRCHAALRQLPLTLERMLAARFHEWAQPPSIGESHEDWANG